MNFESPNKGEQTTKYHDYIHENNLTVMNNPGRVGRRVRSITLETGIPKYNIRENQIPPVETNNCTRLWDFY